MFERKPASIADAMADDPTFAHDETGKPITRDTTCECGTTFRQRLLSERFMQLSERHGARAVELIRQQIPDYYVPVHCPPCERKDLRRRASIDRARTLPDNYLDRDARDHAAD